MASSSIASASRRDMLFTMVGRSSGVAPQQSTAKPSYSKLEEPAVVKASPQQPRRRDMFFSMVALSSGVPARRPRQDTPIVVEEAPKSSSATPRARRRDMFNMMVGRSSGVVTSMPRRPAAAPLKKEPLDSIEDYQIPTAIDLVPSHVFDEDDVEEIETPMTADSMSTISSHGVLTPEHEEYRPIVPFEANHKQSSVVVVPAIAADMPSMVSA